MRSSTLSDVGAAPEAFGIFGLVPMSLSPDDGLTFVAVGAVAVVSATVVCVLSCCSAVLANLSASLSWELPPQAASVSAVAVSASRIGIFFMVIVGPPRPELPPRGEPLQTQRVIALDAHHDAQRRLLDPSSQTRGPATSGRAANGGGRRALVLH